MGMRSTLFAVLLATTGLQPVALHACGYDDPHSIELGSLNWAYPDALYVRTAVSEAEVAGLLPQADPEPRTGMVAFDRATRAMKTFGEKFSDPRAADSGKAISVVLVPQAMWTRFTVGPAGVTMESHTEGPEEDDLVVVTEEKVIQALLDGKIDAPTAEARGLVRYYGDPERIGDVRAALTRAAYSN